MDYPHFQAILLNTLEAEENARQQSEDHLMALLQQSPDVLCQLLLQSLSAPDKMVRTVASVTFRRLANYLVDPALSMWPRLDPTLQASTKQLLLQIMMNEQEPSLRHKHGELVSSLAKNLMGAVRDNPHVDESAVWPELLVTLWQGAHSPNPAMRELCLLIFGQVPGIFGNQMSHYLMEIKQLLLTCLQDTANAEVQLAASRAFAAFTTQPTVDKSQRIAFQELIPVLLQVVATLYQQKLLDEVNDHLDALMDIATYVPTFLRPCMQPIVETLLVISQARSDEQVERIALEVLMVLCEERPQMMRKFPAFAQNVFPILLKMCTEIEDDPEWTHQDEDDVQEDDLICVLGEQSLDRLSNALGGSTVLPIAFQHIPTMIVSELWKDRVAALISIGAIAEGSLNEMKPALGQMMQFIVPCLADPHPRVCYAACNCIGQLALDFAPEEAKEYQTSFQSMFHDSVIPALLNLSRLNEHPRVQAHSVSALINFCDRANKSTLQPYMDLIFQRLSELLASPFRIVQEQTIVCIATVADSSQKLFQHYYSHFMPHLKHILISAQDVSLQMLRGKTMECISLIGVAVGREMFRNDAIDVMTALQGYQSQMVADDDPTVSYMLAAWARMCEILGQEFLPYLDYVLEPLLRSCNLKPEFIMLDDQNPDDAVSDPQNWDFEELDDGRVGIKTSVLDEKRTAFQMVRIYIQQLQVGIASYLEILVTLMSEHIRFVFDDEIRCSVASCVPLLIAAALASPAHGTAVAAHLWRKFASELIVAIEKETTLECISWQIEAVKDCIEVVMKNLGPESVVPFLSELTRVLMLHMGQYEERCLMRFESTADEDFDPEELTKLQKEEGEEIELIREVSNIINVLFNFFGESFLPFFDQLLPYFARMLQQGRSAADLGWGISIFDDLVAACGPASFAYAKYFLEVMLATINHEDTTARQAACYGAGIMALKGGPDYHPYLKNALPRLMSVIQSPTSQEFGNRDATENAVSAILKICLVPEVGISEEQYLHGLLAMLPFHEDQEEATFVYKHICTTLISHLQEGTASLLTQEPFLTQAIKVTIPLANSELLPLDTEVGKMVVFTLHALQQKYPEKFQELFQTMPAETVPTLQAAYEAAAQSQ